jgi:hypothetical protein
VRRARRCFAVVGVAFALSASTLSAASASASASALAPGRHIAGIIPSRRADAVSHVLAEARRGSNLVYHGGPVMRSSRTYAIYWLPPGASMGPGYQSTIDRYFADAAADSGSSTNVYSTLTQYFDTTGKIAYKQTFGGSTVDSRAFPSSGCPLYGGLKRCLTDAQVRAEVRRVAKAKGWKPGFPNAFFLFLPKATGTCFDAAGRDCAFTDFCAYHGYAGRPSNPTIYANQPYADEVPPACASGERPNGSDADSTLNAASHEHREMTNDPLLNAWFDRRGFEGSDKCAYNFGPALGTAPNGERYNQRINGHRYYLQQEWSNASSGCVQRGL